MPSNNSKYTEEMRERTAKFILESGKSATSVAEEMGIDTNTVCRWVRDFRRKNSLPSYSESKGIKQAVSKSGKDYSKQLKVKEKQLLLINEISLTHLIR